jgi:RNA polymerase sigma-70 factor, ECF subfamily
MAQPYEEKEQDPSDAVLVLRARAGDEAAFAGLVRRYERALFNYIRRIVGNAADAEDLFQDVFLRVFSNLNGFDVKKPFRPWLYRIATNRCRDHLRYRKLRRTLSLSYAPEAGVATLAERVPASNPDPSVAAAEGELQERLEGALAALPLKHRTVFIMARYDGMPYEEIAASLGIPVGTVKSRMNKAVRDLTRAVEVDE